jgi:hypothetical protein|uniref:Uncharacterized protein n=1 Tax=viral metagenome TaxID=1070528 RepID=A0A6C0CDS0_9ZZZZ
MSALNSTLYNICKKYCTLDSTIIEERNAITNTKELVNHICNMITSRCPDDDLTRQIMCSSLGGGKKMLTEIIETNEELGTSNFNNVISWKWAKAQLKVNEQRDKIDLLICEVVKAIVSETTLSETNELETTVVETNLLETTPLDKTELVKSQLECEANYLDAVEQKAQDEYEKYLAIKSFLYGVIGALTVNALVVYLNID